MRLNKYIAKMAGVSRREADELIDSNKVTVNGKAATLGQTFKENDIVSVNGEVLEETPHVYLMLNKPEGYVSSRAKQDENPTLYELLPEKYQQLKTVGRLDKDSSGLIILTNDGDFAHEHTHPSFEKSKTYIVTLDQQLSGDDKKQIETGVDIVDGVSKLSLKHLSDKTYEVIMREGRNRQIRRTFGALNYEVVGLKRTKMGKFELGELKQGQTIEITP